MEIDAHDVVLFSFDSVNVSDHVECWEMSPSVSETKHYAGGKETNRGSVSFLDSESLQVGKAVDLSLRDSLKCTLHVKLVSYRQSSDRTSGESQDAFLFPFETKSFSPPNSLGILIPLSSSSASFL